MKQLVPRADQRPLSVDTDAVSSSSEEFNNDMARLAIKTDKVPGAGEGVRDRNDPSCVRGESLT